MALWRRDRRPVIDPEFDFFSEEQGARFRALAQQGFAAAGVETVPCAQHLEAADGRQFGLFNLAATCHRAPGGESAWPSVVRDHVTAVLQSVDQGQIEDLPAEELLQRVYLRVMGTTALPPQWRDRYTYARELGGDLVEVLAVDLPATVAVLGDEDVQRVGIDTLRAAAVRNLTAEPVESHEVTGAEQGPAIHVVEGESFFTASKLLVLQDLLRDMVGEHELPHGVLVSVPTRHQLVFHPITGLTVVEAMQKMAAFTASTYRDGAGSVSPFVYWWDNGQLTQLTSITGEGQLHVMAGDRFTALLNELARQSA